MTTPLRANAAVSTAGRTKPGSAAAANSAAGRLTDAARKNQMIFAGCVF